MTNPHIIGILVFMIPALILVVPGAGEGALGILALLGLVKTIKDRKNPLAQPGNRFLTLICWTFLAVALITVLAVDPSSEGFWRLGTSIHFLFAPFVGVILLSATGIFTRLMQGIKAGAILGGVVALGQIIVRPDEPANGVVNEIIFGDLVLLLGFLGMIRFFEETSREKIITALALALALTAALLSETRNTWVATFILTAGLLILWWRGGHLSARRLATAMAIAIVTALVLSTTPVFQKRYTQMMAELRNLEANPAPSEHDTSVRERLVMWQAAWKTSKKSPLLGHGLHNTTQAVLPHVESDSQKKLIPSFTHLHNEYLNTLVGKGVLGVASLLLLLFGPIFLLWKHQKREADYTLASIGILVCAGFATFGLTNLAFGHGIMNTFFIFMAAIVLPQVKQEALIPARQTATKNIDEPSAATSESLSPKGQPEPQV